MLTAASNKAISDSSPSKYVPELVASLGESTDVVFRSNLLPPPGDFDYAKASYEDFLTVRGEILSKYVATLAEG